MDLHKVSAFFKGWWREKIAHQVGDRAPFVSTGARSRCFMALRAFYEKKARMRRSVTLLMFRASP